MTTDDIYYIRTAWNYFSPIRTLEVLGSSDGVPVQFFRRHGWLNQWWRVQHRGAGHHTIVNVATGKALDVPGGTHRPGVWIQQSQLHAGPNQRWIFRPTSGGAYAPGEHPHEIVNVQSGLALRPPGRYARAGFPVIQHPAATDFVFEPV